MVATASSAEADDIHSHNVRLIPPSVSLDMFAKDPKDVVANSCNSCHVHWGKDKAGYEAGGLPSGRNSENELEIDAAVVGLVLAALDKPIRTSAVHI